MLSSAAVVLIIAISGVVAHLYTSLDWLVAEEKHLRQSVQANPVKSWLMGFALYTGLSLIPGIAGKSIVAGWFFGVVGGVLMVDLALTAAAMITFFASRFIFRESVEARFGVHLVQFRRRVDAQPGFYLLSLRLLHTPFSFLNYAAGATGIVPPRTFWWTTQLGLLPSTIILVYAGTRVPALSVIADKGPLALLDGTLFAGLLATAALPVILRIIVRSIKYVRS
jgi:uncharacterized membrane protein YdjX (TVP38/TMEM64 family)